MMNSQHCISSNFANPMVSVIVITYGHAEFIGDALESIFAQKTNFKVEVIIANDHSPDRTDHIIRKLIMNVPANFSVNYVMHEKNKGAMANFTWALSKVSGKYVAICEGDDYWLDDNKLQMQVDFLEKNQEFGMVYTNLKVLDNISGKITLPYEGLNPPSGDLFEKLLKQNLFAHVTTMYRRTFAQLLLSEDLLRKHNFLMADYPLWLLIGESSKIGYLPIFSALYRQLPESASNTKNIKKGLEFLISKIDIQLFFAKRNDKLNIARESILNHCRSALSTAFHFQYPQMAEAVFNRIQILTVPSLKDRFMLFATKHPSVFKLFSILRKFSGRPPITNSHAST